MTFLEKTSKTTEIKHWLGDMEVDHYLYTSGLAGEKFFSALRDEGKILGAKCKPCGITYVPPRIYCERCFAGLEDSFVDVGLRGKVQTFTIARIDKEENRLEEPEIFAIIAFNENATGFLHKLGEVESSEIKMGMEVEAVLKPKNKREGKITDISYFRSI